MIKHLGKLSPTNTGNLNIKVIFKMVMLKLKPTLPYSENIVQRGKQHTHSTYSKRDMAVGGHLWYISHRRANTARS